MEHEDNEYEAVLEDCFYIFKSTIEIILSQDPVDLLKVIDVKQIVEEPTRITVTQELLDNYEHAPSQRQKEITFFLLSTARSNEHPDVVRENAVEMLRHFKTRTRTQVVIDAAKFLEEKLAGKPIDILTAKLGHACGATGYFKKTKIKDFYAGLYDNIKGAKSDWDKQTQVTTIFHSVGAFTYCPSDLILKIAKYLVSYYIGKPGGYGYYGQNRAVFYSNGAAPIISRIIQHSEQNLYTIIDELREDEMISEHLSNRHILARFENLLDCAQRA